jgi:hypothetical protein
MRHSLSGSLASCSNCCTCPSTLFASPSPAATAHFLSYPRPVLHAQGTTALHCLTRPSSSRGVDRDSHQSSGAVSGMGEACTRYEANIRSKPVRYMPNEPGSGRMRGCKQERRGPTSLAALQLLLHAQQRPLRVRICQAASARAHTHPKACMDTLSVVSAAFHRAGKLPTWQWMEKHSPGDLNKDGLFLRTLTMVRADRC